MSSEGSGVVGLLIGDCQAKPQPQSAKIYNSTVKGTDNDFYTITHTLLRSRWLVMYHLHV